MSSFEQRLLPQILLPAVIGVATGCAVGGLSSFAEGLALPALAALPGLWPAAFSPLIFFATLGVSHFITRAAGPSTTELYILTYHEAGSRLPLRQIPGRVLAGLTTVALGGSQGLESPSALLGAALSQVAAKVRRFALCEADRHTLLVAGASAGIAAVFSSPGVGALYGMEIPWRRDLDAPRLVPCALAAACSYGTRAALVGTDHLIRLEHAPSVDPIFVAGAIAVALASGLVARLFAAITELARRQSRKHSPLARAVIGGLLLTVLALAGHALTSKWITFGPGYIAAGWLLSTEHLASLVGVVLLIRTAGTLVSMYGGGGGGVFTSLACTGAFVGEVVARWVGRADDAYALLGAACVLGAAYRIPLAAMLYVAESGGGVTLSMLGVGGVALAQAIIGSASVSDAQRDVRTRD